MRPAVFLIALWIAGAAALVAQPAVVATAEGQIGEAPGFGGQVIGTRLESIRGQPGDVLLGGLFVPGGFMPPPPEFAFLTDMIHGYPDPVPLDATSSLFANTLKRPPASNRSQDGDFVAFAFAIDGSMPQTMTVRIATFDDTGTPLTNVPVAVDLGTFPDPSLNDTGVAVDNQGRVTVAYTDLTALGTRVLASRVDAITGVVDPNFDGLPVTGLGRAATDIALLDPAGNRLLVPSSTFAGINGNIVDTTGPAPVVLPDFPISTTPALFANLAPAAAADPTTGASMVVWENVSALQGDPINIRGRRFDADGNPVGNDFQVNTVAAETQGQPAVAMGTGGLAAAVWASDSAVAGDELDVKLQVYDANGNPIGGEIRVNTTTAGVQDQPAVRFLPDPDGQGRPQFAVVWRDVGNASGANPNGTGTSYRCFSIDGLEDPNAAIFADGFESGDTTSWSDEQP